MQEFCFIQRISKQHTSICFCSAERELFGIFSLPFYSFRSSEAYLLVMFCVLSSVVSVAFLQVGYFKIDASADLLCYYLTAAETRHLKGINRR